MLAAVRSVLEGPNGMHQHSTSSAGCGRAEAAGVCTAARWPPSQHRWAAHLQPGHPERATWCTLTSMRIDAWHQKAGEPKSFGSVSWACIWHGAARGSSGGVAARGCRSLISPFQRPSAEV